MKIVVQKFGGTSVATPEARAAVRKKIIEAVSNGFSPIVVVSAMGRSGDAYATDSLIDVIKNEYRSVSARNLDTIMCCGELISAAVMAASLESEGLQAVALTGGQAGIWTDDNFGAADIIDIDVKVLKSYLAKAIIPVVCGFQGRTEDGIFTTLGRGGSDTTAAALGAALQAEAVEIYTDVDGIMTADPRVVSKANILDCVSYADVCQMAHQGAKVIHPRAVEIAMKKEIPIIVKSTFSDAPGTLICTEEAVSRTSNHLTRIISGVAYLKDLAQFKVQLDSKIPQLGKHLYDELAKNKISVGCLNLQPELSMFSVFMFDCEKTHALLTNDGFDFEVHNDCAKVSIVGSGMRGVHGIMATFVAALTENGITILQMVDSDTTISAIVHQEQLNNAVTALHDAFGL
ncbi:MAG TPA: aspartate kinase [Candidatus Avacidaminococcus intestinavium]|uniref:Aspartokinase n=1 Tax=Candidatus Avacidaminococcus intestinavium TaxID=2840684 RepID=A0A9D1MQL8_9FIRM|nr:aspartate kinase [Candidatus Avacidaminococcus intestinavium]